MPPVAPLEKSTTYNMSFWPNCQIEKPTIVIPQDEIKPARGHVDPCTTYKLSYFDGTGPRSEPAARPVNNLCFSQCPMTHDTVNKVRFVMINFNHIILNILVLLILPRLLL